MTSSSVAEEATDKCVWEQTVSATIHTVNPRRAAEAFRHITYGDERTSSSEPAIIDFRDTESDAL
jgi:hypothetical protein